MRSTSRPLKNIVVLRQSLLHCERPHPNTFRRNLAGMCQAEKISPRGTPPSARATAQRSDTRIMLGYYLAHYLHFPEPSNPRCYSQC
jgi:hypothetical protein